MANQILPPPETMPAPDPDAGPITFDTIANTRHAVRVLCDRAGLTLYSKNVITACVEVESNFENYLPSGQPTIHQNKDGAGKVLSTDWGLCQINDYYHIGANKDFPSVAFVMENPDKVVAWMIQMMKEGHLNQWVSFSSGAYLKYMP